MPTLIVVNEPRDWPLAIEGAEVVAARSYLTDPAYAELRNARVFNLCRSYRYQTAGYYVSLLAAARGHKPQPDITTVQDLKSQTMVRFASEDLEEEIQTGLGCSTGTEREVIIIFGHHPDKRLETLSSQLFKLFQAPFLKAEFQRDPRACRWHLTNINAVAASEIPVEHWEFAVAVARDYFSGRRRLVRRRASSRFDLAILHDPAEREPPSNHRAIQRFTRAAELLGLAVESIRKEDYGRLAEFDALFIRETTSVNHHTYRFARRAAAEGLVVVDDPESILKCTNKVFLAEVLTRHKVPVPRTLIVHRDNAEAIVPELGLPCVLKKPDSSFSQGVVKVESAADLGQLVPRLLDKSDLIIAQEFVPTPFDWRVGIFDRQPLYVCKYFMAKKHWQIIKRDSAGRKTADGESQTLPVEHAPGELIRTALRAANLVGDGLYGVDLKERDGRFVVIEVNDNPNIDAGIEDAALKEELYLRIMRVMLRRIEARKRGQWSWA
ncbi:MAG: RimK family protein [Thermodesulfobacteriota bacterium]